MPPEKVLLIDDEEEFISALSARMENRGLTVETALSGEEALKKIESKSYDAIFLDLAMPGLDGIETLKRIRETKPDLQVILLTGQGSLEKGIEAMKHGALDFLEKPADIQKMMKKVNEAASKRAVLVEKRMEEKLNKILKEKPW